jgi:FixJ family two-component response regulator
MPPVVSSGTAVTRVRPCVLVVDDEPGLLELVAEVAGPLDCRIVTAGTIEQAEQILLTQRVEVLVTDVHLPDGDGVSLLPILQRRNPSASAVVITGQPTVEKAIAAVREGAVDFIPKPFNNDLLLSRLRNAIEIQARAARGERKIERLRIAVRRLNNARRLISKKVDLLCNDLVSAYGDVSRQLEDVRTREGFRKYVAGAKDLEQLLCHAMDWLLRQVGYSNVAVWLASEEGDYQLGAYMKYTVAGEPLLTDALRRVVLPAAPADGVVRLRGAALADKLTPQEFKLINGHEILALNCTYLGESLAALVFFRTEQNPFTEDDQALLKSIGSVFAVALAGVVRDTPEGPGEAEPDDSPGGTDTREGPGDKGKDKRNARDSADWWKRGEPPPF